MKNDRSPGVLVLGACGRFGRAAVDAFRLANWKVLAQSRSRPDFPVAGGVEVLICDALDTQTLIEAAKLAGVEVIVNGLNPDYTQWDSLVPAITDSVLRLAQGAGALLMLPGNVYNFGHTLPPVLTEGTAQVANTPKAAVRIALEERMRASAAQGVRSVVIRAGDFLGGAGPGTWLDMVIARKLARDEVTYPGALDLPHAWAYLPDLARVFVAVAAEREQLSPFEVFHYEGLTLTGRELHAEIERVQGRELRLKKMPWWLLRIAAPFVPMFAALLEMRYLWERPHQLDESKLAGLINTVPHTPLNQALRLSLPVPADSSRPARVA